MVRAKERQTIGNFPRTEKLTLELFSRSCHCTALLHCFCLSRFCALSTWETVWSSTSPPSSSTMISSGSGSWPRCPRGRLRACSPDSGDPSSARLLWLNTDARYWQDQIIWPSIGTFAQQPRFAQNSRGNHPNGTQSGPRRKLHLIRFWSRGCQPTNSSMYVMFLFIC